MIARTRETHAHIYAHTVGESTRRESARRDQPAVVPRLKCIRFRRADSRDTVRVSCFNFREIAKNYEPRLKGREIIIRRPN